MPSSPADVLADLLRTDPGAPRLTCYDDAAGERIELSAKTLANWANKAANLLQEDADAAPGTTVGLDLPAHWRTAYWALATWLVGAGVVVGPAAVAADVVVTADPAVAAATSDDGRYAVLVTLAALARAHPNPPPGVIDEAKELSSYGDAFDAWATPSGQDVALRDAAGDAAYAELVAGSAHPAGARVRVPDEPGALLRAALAAWSVGGSVVLVHRPSGDQARRMADERVTVDIAAD